MNTRHCRPEVFANPAVESKIRREGELCSTRGFAVIGGDKRNVYLSKLLENDGNEVRKFGFDTFGLEQIEESPNLYEAINGADYIIGPTPCSGNNHSLNAVYSSKAIMVDDLFRLIKPTQIFFSGHIKEEVQTLAKKYGVNCVDMLLWEELALLNAIPTAVLVVL